MIIVIADDFTGAAEMGGIALRFGLRVEVQTSYHLPSPVPDVLVLDTNTRSGSAENAIGKIEKTMKELGDRPVDLIYKKTDSVFRGHIREELETILSCMPGKSILLAPANPSSGRTIKDGHYYINGTLLHQSVFADDPESPVHTSDVLGMLGHTDIDSIQVLKNGKDIRRESIAIGEADTMSQLRDWAEKINTEIIPAGAADFFHAILKERGFDELKVQEQKVPNRAGRALFVCGSSLSKAAVILEGLKHKNTKVVEMPCKFLSDSDVKSFCDDRWIEETVRSFDSYRNVIIVVGDEIPKGHVLLSQIPPCLAKITEEVVHRIPTTDLYIEGGSTASAVVRKLGWNRFVPIQELAPGVVRMEVGKGRKQYITVKPGSYMWPDTIWDYVS
jgi:D-threonate/D-erythronate kinase